MKKTVLLATALAFVLSMALAVGTSLADDGPADMVLKTAAGKKPATFAHKKHQDMDGIECASCHHSAGDGKKGPYVAGQEKKCESCHNKDMANPKLNSYKAVGHALCKDCHKKMKAEGKSAPTKCGGCHPKK